LELRAFIQPLVSLEDHPSCYPTTRTPVQPLFYQSSAVVMDTSFELSQYAFDPEFPVSLEEISSNDSEMELYTATGDEGKRSTKTMSRILMRLVPRRKVNLMLFHSIDGLCQEIHEKRLSRYWLHYNLWLIEVYSVELIHM
jgi:hypothetical protein